MKHKHSELIKLWADGTQIEWLGINGDWYSISGTPAWNIETTYRIKPMPKPDFYTYLTVDYCHTGAQTIRQFDQDTVKFTYDGETRKLKSAEVIK
jgi:hypothetical protein